MLNYVNRVLVEKSAGGVNSGNTLTTLGRGDLLVINGDTMAPITAAPGSQVCKSFFVAVGTGYPESPFILSSRIFGDNVTSAGYKATRAAADQVTSVSIPAPAIDDIVNITIAFKDRMRLIANKQTRFVINAKATTTVPYDLANELAKQARFSSPYADPYGIKVEVTTVGTDSVAVNGATVTKGSDVITFATAATHGAAVAFVVGDYIELDGVTYKITAVDSLDITLDRVYAGDSAVLANTAINQKTTLTATNLRITGVDSPYNNAEIDVYEKVVFEVGTDQVGSVVTTSTVADLGQGIARQVKKMEFDAQGYLGNANLRQWPIPAFDFHAVDGAVYNIQHLTAYDEHEGDLQDQMKSPVGLTIAFTDADATAENLITSILNDLIPGFTI